MVDIYLQEGWMTMMERGGGGDFFVIGQICHFIFSRDDLERLECLIETKGRCERWSIASRSNSPLTYDPSLMFDNDSSEQGRRRWNDNDDDDVKYIQTRHKQISRKTPIRPFCFDPALGQIR